LEWRQVRPKLFCPAPLAAGAAGLGFSGWASGSGVSGWALAWLGPFGWREHEQWAPPNNWHTMMINIFYSISTLFYFDMIQTIYAASILRSLATQNGELDSQYCHEWP
jgi:hypothetical protein